MKYLVEIIPESITDRDAAISSLAATLKIEPAKAANLLKRNPVTKPVSQTEAEKVARLFTKAGIEVFVRAEEEMLATAPLSRAIEQPESLTEVDPVVTTEVQPTHTQTQPVQQTNDDPVRPAVQNVHDLGKDLGEVAESLPSSHVASDRLPTHPGLESTVDTAKVLGSVREPSSVKEPSVVPEVDSRFNHKAFQAKSVQGEETLNIPSGFFTPVPEGAITSHSELSSPDLPVTEELMTSKPVGGLGKIVFASMVPGLLALAGVFTALYLFGLPFLRSQQRTSAETAAVSLASSIGGWVGDVSLDNSALTQQVQNVIARTQGELRGRGVDLVLLTDTEGNQLAGWYKNTQSVPDTVATTDAVRAQLSNAVGGAVAATTDIPLGESDPNARLTIDGETLGLASAAVRQGNTPVGSVVVGVGEQSLMDRVQALLPTLLLAGVLPLVLGILVSLLLGRNRT